MKTPQSKITIIVVCVCALLSACASPSRQAARPPGVIGVVYTQVYPDGGRLKEIPTEVTIVKREATTSLVGAQVALNVVMLAMGGGFGFQSFSKDGFKGAVIEGSVDRVNLTDPAAGTFMVALRASVNDAVQADTTLRQKIFNNSLNVIGGTKLVYETLTGTDEERYRLKTDLMIFKKKESAGLVSVTPFVTVNCQNQSPVPLTQATWAENNYQIVKNEVESMYAACQKKVLADLHNLLKD